MDEAKRIFRAYGVPGNLRQMVTEEHHFFGPEVVKVLIGWFDLHLKKEGNGEPVDSLPDYDPLPEDELLVYPKGKRAADVISIPEYLKVREEKCLAAAVFDPAKRASQRHVASADSFHFEDFCNVEAGCTITVQEESFLNAGIFESKKIYRKCTS